MICVMNYANRYYIHGTPTLTHIQHAHTYDNKETHTHTHTHTQVDTASYLLSDL